MSNATMQAWRGFDAVAFARLAEAHGTPYYLYDAGMVRQRVEAVRAAFRGRVGVYYAVKANPNLELLRALRADVDGLDISSGGELSQALQAGYDAGNLSFAGPAKSDEELEQAIVAEVGCISVESVSELERCIGIAERSNTRAHVVLRVNPRFLNRSYGMKMGGRPVQFGIDEEQLGATAEVLLRGKHVIDFRGIHVYAGSQCFNVDGAADGVRDTLRIVETFERETGLACRLINLGGGFGVSHSDTARELDVNGLGVELLPSIESFASSSVTTRRVIFELGRFLAAEAGVYVCRVVGSKVSRGKAFFLLDGGLHHHLAAAGTFGTAFRSNFVLGNLSRPEAPPLRCNLSGPSCNPTDLLGVDVELAEPRPGDLIGVFLSGSYGLTASPLLFLGRRTPVELVADAGAVTVGRRAFTIADLN